eukprot:scaffold17594_cov42-Phaeocystis_antarctica.AAC.2
MSLATHTAPMMRSVAESATRQKYQAPYPSRSALQTACGSTNSNPNPNPNTDPKHAGAAARRPFAARLPRDAIALRGAAAPSRPRAAVAAADAELRAGGGRLDHRLVWSEPVCSEPRVVSVGGLVSLVSSREVRKRTDKGQRARYPMATAKTQNTLRKGVVTANQRQS